MWGFYSLAAASCIVIFNFFCKCKNMYKTVLFFFYKNQIKIKQRQKLG